MTKMMTKAYNEVANYGFSNGLDAETKMSVLEGQMASKLERKGVSVSSSELRNFINARNAEVEAVTSDFNYGFAR